MQITKRTIIIQYIVLLCNTPSEARALVDSARIETVLAVDSASILDCNNAFAVNLAEISEDMLAFIPDTSRVLDSTSESILA